MSPANTRVKQGNKLPTDQNLFVDPKRPSLQEVGEMVHLPMTCAQVDFSLHLNLHSPECCLTAVCPRR